MAERRGSHSLPKRARKHILRQVICSKLHKSFAEIPVVAYMNRDSHALTKTIGTLPAALLTAQQLASELNLPNAGTVKALARKRKIPVTRFGYRTLRFDLERVRAALSKLEVRAI